MTLDEAVETGRRLEAEAAAGWPKGLDRILVAMRATEALEAINQHLREHPEPEAEARDIWARIERREAFKATVPTKRERRLVEKAGNL